MRKRVVPIALIVSQALVLLLSPAPAVSSAAAGGVRVTGAAAEVNSASILQFSEGQLRSVETGQDLVRALSAPLPGRYPENRVPAGIPGGQPRLGDLLLDMVVNNLEGDYAISNPGWFPDPSLGILVPFLQGLGFKPVNWDPEGKGGTTGRLLEDWSPKNRRVRGVGIGPWGPILSGLAGVVTRSVPTLQAQAPAPVDMRVLAGQILTHRFGPATAAALMASNRGDLSTRGAAIRLFAKPRGTQIDAGFAGRIFDDIAAQRALEYLMSGGKAGGYGAPYADYGLVSDLTMGWGTAAMYPTAWRAKTPEWVERMRALGLYVGMSPQELDQLAGVLEQQRQQQAAAQRQQFLQGSP